MTLAFCITCYDQDIYYVPILLAELQKQTCAPDTIIVSSSGFANEAPISQKEIVINDTKVPIIKVNRPQRGLPGFAKNQAINICKENLIMIFDCDDEIHPQKIEFTKQIFLDHDCDAVLHDYNFNVGTPFVLYDKIDQISQITQKEPYCTNVVATGKVHHSHITVKTKIAQKILYDEFRGVGTGEDGLFCQQLLDYRYKIMYCGLPLVNYRIKQ